MRTMNKSAKAYRLRNAWVLAVAVCGVVSASAHADSLYELTQTFTGSNGIIDATFKLVDYHTLQITVTNNVTNPTSDAEGISGLKFTLNNANVNSLSLAMGTQITIAQGGTYTYPQGNTATSLSRWADTIANSATTSNNNMNIFTGGSPYQVIMGGPNASDQYSNANKSITNANHNPAVKQTAVFTLDITRVGTGAISIADFGTSANQITANFGTMTGQEVAAAYKSGSLSIPATLSLAVTPTCQNFIVGTQRTMTVNVGNTTVAGPNSNAANFTLSGSPGISGLPTGTQTRAAGDANAAAGAAYTANYTSSTAGANQTFTVTATDPNASNSPQSASFTANVYNHATVGSFTGGTINVGNLHEGYGAFTATPTLNVTNGSASDYRVALKGSANPSGNVSLTTIGGLLAGQNATISATVAAGRTAGAINQSLTYTFGDDATGICGTSNNIAQATVQVQGQVYSGQSTWTGSGDGTWGGDPQLAATHANWDSAGGAPGVWTGFDNVDTATFANSIGSSPATIGVTSPVSVKSITFDNTQGGSYTVAASGGSVTLNSDTGTANLSNLNGSHTITAPVTLQSDVIANVQNAGDKLTVSQLLQGSGGTQTLTKAGAGTLALTGTSTCTGLTTVSSGTLEVDGGIASAVDVKAGGTLSGTNGTALGSATVESGGTISPGADGSSSKLTVGGFFLQGGGTYQFDIAAMTGDGLQTGTGTSYDTVASTGALDLTGLSSTSPFKLAVDDHFSSGFDYTHNYAWQIASYASGINYADGYDPTTVNSLFAINLSLFNTYNHGSWSVSTGGGNLYLNYTYNAVPEAGTAVFGMMALMPILAHRRRRPMKDADVA